MERSRPQRQQRREPAADLRRRLPDRLRGRPARLRTEAGRQLRRTARPPKPRYYLFDRKPPHKLIAGPEFTRKDLYISPTGKKRPARAASSLEVPAGTVLVSEQPTDNSGKIDEDRRARLVRAQGRPGALGHRHHQPEAGTSTNSTSPTSPSASPTSGRAAPSRKSPARSPSAARRRRSARSAAKQAAALSGHFAVVLDNEVKTRPIINFAENPDGIDGRTGAQISGGFNSIEEAQDLATIPADRRPADQPQADQPDAGLGDARQPGAPRRASRPGSSASRSSSSSCSSSTASSA